MSTQSRSAGTMLLRIARYLFEERFFEEVVEPTIADLQREVVDAGDSRVRRARARWRGYCAFWLVALVSPFASWTSGAAAPAFPDAAARVVTGTILLTVFGLAGGAWLMLGIGGGALVALVLHRWYDGHPSELPQPAELQRRFPQINYSSTDVAGNIGGLIFVVGSLLIVSLALPSVLWFLITSSIAAAVVAWCLAAWHQGDRRQSGSLVLR